MHRKRSSYPLAAFLLVSALSLGLVFYGYSVSQTSTRTVYPLLSNTSRLATDVALAHVGMSRLLAGEHEEAVDALWPLLDQADAAIEAARKGTTSVGMVSAQPVTDTKVTQALSGLSASLAMFRGHLEEAWNERGEPGAEARWARILDNDLVEFTMRLGVWNIQLSRIAQEETANEQKMAYVAFAVSGAAIALACIGLVLTLLRQRRITLALGDSEARYRQLVERADAIILTVDRTGHIRFINPAGASAFGKSPAALLGKSCTTAFPEAFSQSVNRMLVNVVALATSQADETAVVCNGTTTWYRVTVHPFAGDTEERTALVIATDITGVRRTSDELRQANKGLADVNRRLVASRNEIQTAYGRLEQREKELRASREMLQSVMDNIPLGIFWKDRKSVYLGANRHFIEVQNPEIPRQIVGLTDRDMPWRALAEEYRVKDEAVMATDESNANYYERVRYHDGSVKWLRKSKFPLHDPDGAVVGVLGIYEDVTEQKMSRDRIQRNYEFQRQLGSILIHSQQSVGLEAKLTHALKTVTSGPWTVAIPGGCIYTARDHDGTLLLEASHRLDQELVDELAVLPVGLCMCGKPLHGNTIEHHHPDAVQGGVQDGLGSHYSIPLVQGSELVGLMVLQMTSAERLDGDEEASLTTLANSLAGIVVRTQAEELNKRLTAAVEQVSECIVITDTSGVIQYVNPAFEAVSGYRREEVIGRTPALLKSGKHTKDLYQDLWNTIGRGEVWEGHLVNRRKDGRLWDEDATIAPLRNSEGEIVYYVAVKRDVTEELAREKYMRQMQKMEAIGTLAGGIAHDFNNILTAILGYTEIGLHDTGNPDSVGTAFHEILHAGQRAKELVGQILTFSRQGEHELRPVKVQLVLKEVLKLLRATLPSTIEIHESVDTQCGLVLADATQLHQVVMNLCTNAFHAMIDTGGVLEVILRQVALNRESTALFPEMKDGNYIRLTVRDTGTGIPPEVIERIFEPFFTTKPVGQGTGMGLSTVHGIITQYGGTVKVQSEVGKGSTFDVYLACIEAEEEQKKTETRYASGGTERILFVDDEPQICALGERLLSRLGYRVTACESSVEALQIFRERADEFDLIITDQTMPKLTGVDLARHVRQIRGALPVLLMTGLSESVTVDQAQAAGIVGCVMKPFVVRELNERIRAVLDAVGQNPSSVTATAPSNGYARVGEDT